MSETHADHSTSRREFLGRATATGAGAIAGSTALGALAPSLALAGGHGNKGKHLGAGHGKKHGNKKRDLEILGAAQIAKELCSEK